MAGEGGERVKYLTLLPDKKDNKQPPVDHLAKADGSSWCGLLTAGDGRKTGQVWTLADNTEKSICSRCKQNKAAAERKPMPNPEVKNPTAFVQIITRDVPHMRVHAWKAHADFTNTAHCNRTSESGKWIVRNGTMGEVTCKQCLKELGELVGHEKPQGKQVKSKPARDKPVEKDWDALLATWKAGAQ